MSVLSNQMLLLQRATDDLQKERQDREEEKVRYLGDKLPPLQLSGLPMDELQVRLKDNNIFYAIIYFAYLPFKTFSF